MVASTYAVPLVCGDDTWRQLVSSRLGQIASVLDQAFGAKGDGVADDAPPINAALAWANTQPGGAVYLPAGRYRVASTLNIAAARLFGASWGSVIVPASDAIGTLFNATGQSAEIFDLSVDGSAVASPTYTALNVNNAGFGRFDNLWINGAGVGVNEPAGNANRFSNMRIQACATCVQTGGVAGSFPGDTTWSEIVAIPTAAGTGWIIDGNSNAQYMNRVEIIGGAKCLSIRGAGAGTSKPDGILINFGNFTASSGSVVEILKGSEIRFSGGTIIGGSTGGDGVLINAATASDVDGVVFTGAQIRANRNAGLNWQRGSNVVLIGGEVYGNSNGGGAGVFSNIFVGSNATGLCQIVGVMCGLSAAGEVFANIQAPAKYGVELASAALTDATNYPGRLMLVGNVWDGNTGGAYIDGSAPAATRKVIKGNLPKLTGTATYNPPAIATGASVATTVAVAGVSAVQKVSVSFSLDLQGLILTAYVSGGNIVTVVFANLTGAPVDLASGTLTVEVGD